MSAPPAWLANPGAVVSSIAGSTAETDHPGLAQFMAEALAAARVPDYPGRVRDGIRRAAASMPPFYRDRPVDVQRHIERAGPERFGLRRVPDITTIREEVRKKGISCSESTFDQPTPCNASTRSTT